MSTHTSYIFLTRCFRRASLRQRRKKKPKSMNAIWILVCCMNTAKKKVSNSFNEGVNSEFFSHSLSFHNYATFIPTLVIEYQTPIDSIHNNSKYTHSDSEVLLPHKYHVWSSNLGCLQLERKHPASEPAERHRWQQHKTPDSDSKCLVFRARTHCIKFHTSEWS